MTISAKISLLVGLLVGVLWLSSALLVNRILLDGFRAAEISIADQNRVLGHEAVERELDRLQTLIDDWAPWVDAWEFVQRPNERFVARNLAAQSLSAMDIDLLLFLRPDGTLVWGAAVDYASGRLQPPTGVAANLLNESRVLVQQVLGRQPLRGLVKTPQGPMFVLGEPVLHSDRSGPPAGILLFGRLVNRDWTSAARALVHRSGSAQLQIHDPSAAELTPEIRAVAGELAASGRSVLSEARDDQVHTYVLYRDLAGAAALLLEIGTQRHVMAYGLRVSRVVLAGLAVIQALAIGLLWVLLARLVVRPIQTLRRYVAGLHRHHVTAPVAEVPVSGNDEIGVLAREFHQLVLTRHVAETDMRRLAAAVHHAAESIEILDRDGRILYVNPVYERQTGVPLAEARGRRPETIKHISPDDPAYQQMIRAIMRGETWSGQLRSTAATGIFIEDVTASPIREADGRVSAYVAVKRDVTDRLLLEQQLRQAQKLEAVGQLSAGIAHEINTPIQYVGDNLRFLQECFTGLTTLLDTLGGLARRGPQPLPAQALHDALAAADASYLRDEIPRAVSQSLEGIERISDIIRAMKEFSHPAPDRVSIDLNAAVRSTIRIAAAQWKSVAQFRTDLDPALPTVSCIPGELNQALLNVIVNAAQAIAETQREGAVRPGEIIVSTRHDGGQVEIVIADNGCGIPEAIRERIFDPFFTTRPVGEGTGQGLAITYQVIVQRHDGTIRVESKPGQGTRFIIRLPLTATVPTAAAAA